MKHDVNLKLLLKQCGRSVAEIVSAGGSKKLRIESKLGWIFRKCPKTLPRDDKRSHFTNFVKIHI